MNEIGGVNSVLAQIRAMRGQIDGVGGQTTNAATALGMGASGGGVGGLSPNSFTSALGKAVDQVSKSQGQASTLAEAFERGDRSTSVAQVMLSMQKAQVEFKALAEVRNRLVQAYQDIQNMPL